MKTGLMAHIFSFIIILLLVFATGVSANDPRQIDREARHRARIFLPVQNAGSPAEISMTAARTNALADQLISETITPAAFHQSVSSVARVGSNRIVAVWQDDRLGAKKIFAQLYDTSGNAISSNIQVAGRSDGYDLIEPKAAADGLGGFFLAWRDIAAGRIYAARYNSSMSRLVDPFPINDTLVFGYAGPFDIDCFSDGSLAVVWERYTSVNDIVIRLFNQYGVSLTNVLTVNSDNSDVSRWVPTVAINKSGGIGVAWEDYRNGNADIYMRLLNQDGSPSGVDFGLVEAASDDSAQYQPEIAHSPLDGYAVAWLDRRNGKQKVYLQRVVPGTGLIGGNQLTSESDAATNDWDISLAINSANYLVAGWTSIGAEEKIILQKFSGGFALSGGNLTVNSFADGSRWETSLCLSVTNRVLCSWTDLRAGNPDIYLQLLSSAGVSLLASDKLVNDDSRGAPSYDPDILPLGLSQHGVVFASARYDDGDIYLQRVSAVPILMGANQKINTDTLAALQNEPSLAVSGSKMLVVWNDSRALNGITGQRIFGRFGTTSGIFSDHDFNISDSGNINSKSGPAAAMSRGQTALVAWSDFRGGTNHIIGRLVKEPDIRFSSEFAISTAGIDYSNSDISIGRDSSDNFTVAWLAHGNSGTALAAVCRYNAAGTFLNRFNFSSDISGAQMTDIATAVNDSGDVYLLWIGDNGVRHLYLTVLSKTGVIKKATFEITNNAAANPREPDIAVDAYRSMVATWTDFRNGKRAIYYQALDQSYSSLGPNAAVSESSPEFMISPAVAVYNGRAWFTWIDPRLNGANIYQNAVLYSPTGIDDDADGTLPTDFALDQNFPNPFNPSTAIRFSLPTRSRVELAVYDLLGQRVRTLTDRVFEAGRHELIWDGLNDDGQKAASGVYFYRIKTGDFSLSRKMVLIK